MNIYVHADDFGISDAQTEKLIGLVKAGAVQSVSILANDPSLPEHVTALRCASDSVRLSVHVNFVEGASCLDPNCLPDLVDERGMFCLSYGKLLMKSLLPGRARRRLFGELIAEAAAQITAVSYCQPMGLPLAVDTHQHTLAIPLVFRAVLRAIEDHGFNISELRLPREALGPYLAHPSVLTKIPAVNYIKLLLINGMLLFRPAAYRRSGLVSPDFAGVLMTAGVDERHVEKVLPALAARARRRGRALELLFHPARIEAASACPDPDNAPFRTFNTSPRRDEERDIVLSIKPMIDKLRAESV